MRSTAEAEGRRKLQKPGKGWRRTEEVGESGRSSGKDEGDRRRTEEAREILRKSLEAEEAEGLMRLEDTGGARRNTEEADEGRMRPEDS